MSKTRNKLILIIAFACMILLPFPLQVLFGNGTDTELRENRLLAEKPVFSLSAIDAYPQAYEAYLNDHLPFRNPMIRAYNRVEYGLLRSSMTYRVIFGKDGWLFYRDRYDGNPIANYKGIDRLTEDQLVRMRDNLVGVRDRLAARDIAFVVFIVPNKERVYAKYMPDLYGDPAPEYAILQIVDYLRAHSDLRVVYANDALKEAAEALGDTALLYRKTDTHWNELGGYVGGSVLLSELGITLPTYDDKRVTIEELPDETGDLMQIANIEGLVDPGKTYRVSGYDTHDLRFTDGDFDTVMYARAEGADPRKVLFHHDSFGECMQDLFCAQFSETVMVHHLAWDPEIVEREAPEVFVLEVAERSAAGALMSFSY